MKRPLCKCLAAIDAIEREWQAIQRAGGTVVSLARDRRAPRRRWIVLVRYDQGERAGIGGTPATALHNAHAKMSRVA